MTGVSDDPAIGGNAVLPPSTADYIRFHALHRPMGTALINNGQEFTFRRLYRDLKKFTRALREILPPAGNSVAVECDDLYLHWLLLLACETLGVVTASLLIELSRIMSLSFSTPTSKLRIYLSWVLIFIMQMIRTIGMAN